jgi:hypothetical protein
LRITFASSTTRSCSVPREWDGLEPGEHDGASILDTLVEEVRRFVVITDTAADLVALWIAHTHVLDAAEATPYLWIHGPERRVGKSRLLDVMSLYVRKPIATANISVAALFRVVAHESPTLLFDEVDTIFGSKARENEDLRGLVNAGFQRGAKVYRCVGDGSKQKVESFEVFCPKAFAGIGDEFPETVADRSIPVVMKRKTREEQVERFRIRAAGVKAKQLREALVEWASSSVDPVAAVRPELPDDLDDRAQDAWEPLLAVAEVAGGDWPERALAAALELSAGEARVDDSQGVRLLAAVRRAFLNAETEELRTRDLLQTIATEEESPWSWWWDNGKNEPVGGASEKLAYAVRPFGVRSERIRVEGAQVRGYRRDRFLDAFERYLPAANPSQLVLSDTPNDASNPLVYREESSKTGSPPSGQEGFEEVELDEFGDDLSSSHSGLNSSYPSHAPVEATS